MADFMQTYLECVDSTHNEVGKVKVAHTSCNCYSSITFVRKVSKILSKKKRLKKVLLFYLFIFIGVSCKQIYFLNNFFIFPLC